jgi:HK97 family phage portal protein
MASWNWIPRWMGGGITRKPGIQTGSPLIGWGGKKASVTEESAMQISAVWAAVQLKSSVLGSLAIHFYERQGDGRMEVSDYPLAVLFSTKPNQLQTRVEFFETLGLNLYLTGNFYGKIERIGGRITSITPLMSSQMEVELLPDGSVVYTYTNGVDVNAYSADSIWHVKLLSNGIKGLSPLMYAKNAISTAILAEEWAGNTVGNAGKPSGVLSYDKLLTKEQRGQLKEKFKDLQEGSQETLMVLEAGMKYDKVSMSPQEVQLLDSRRFQIEDIARFFNVPSVMINDTSGSTVWGSGIEQIITGWYKLGFRPELERIEASIINNLVPARDRGKISVEFDFEELLRTDFKTRVDTGARVVNAGLMTRNEWRKREWLPVVEGGDDLTVQVNLTPIEDLAKVSGVQNGTNPEAT